FSGYLSGQVLDAAIMSALFSIAFLIVRLPHGILLGLVSGFSNIIPYFGAVTAFVLAVMAGLFSGTPIKAVYASVFILLLQQIDSLYIVPKVVGKRLELHPVLVLLSLAVFGRMFGFWGLVFAVPLGALFKMLLLWLYDRKNDSIRP
ncbi:MAG: AI-2E family transporter, partial [Anaerotignum sp.]|nr:AI-2E family transporter [Anaerotignum sp.]